MSAKKSEHLTLFLSKKQEVSRVIALAMEAQLVGLGADIQGLSWFSSSAESYARMNAQKAAA